jgi:hypothetical protein
MAFLYIRNPLLTSLGYTTDKIEKTETAVLFKTHIGLRGLTLEEVGRPRKILNADASRGSCARGWSAGRLVHIPGLLQADALSQCT